MHIIGKAFIAGIIIVVALMFVSLFSYYFIKGDK
jgi:hypothetical protein